MPMPGENARARYCDARQAAWTQLACRSMVARRGLTEVARGTGLSPETVARVASGAWDSIRTTTYARVLSFVRRVAEEERGNSGDGGEE